MFRRYFAILIPLMIASLLFSSKPINTHRHIRNFYKISRMWSSGSSNLMMDISGGGGANVGSEHSSGSKKWTLQFDGGSRGNPGLGGAGAVIYYRDDDGDNKEVWNGYFFIGKSGITNNVAEYHGLIEGLKQVIKMKIKSILIEGDSQLVIRQIQGIYNVNNKNLRVLHSATKSLVQQIPDCGFNHIPRNMNGRADMLSNIAMDRMLTETFLSTPIMEMIKEASRSTDVQIELDGAAPAARIVAATSPKKGKKKSASADADSPTAKDKRKKTRIAGGSTIASVNEDPELLFANRSGSSRAPNNTRELSTLVSATDLCADGGSLESKLGPISSAGLSGHTRVVEDLHHSMRAAVSLEHHKMFFVPVIMDSKNMPTSVIISEKISSGLQQSISNFDAWVGGSGRNDSDANLEICAADSMRSAKSLNEAEDSFMNTHLPPLQLNFLSMDRNVRASSNRSDHSAEECPAAACLNSSGTASRPALGIESASRSTLAGERRDSVEVHSDYVLRGKADVIEGTKNSSKSAVNAEKIRNDERLCRLEVVSIEQQNTRRVAQGATGKCASGNLDEHLTSLYPHLSGSDSPTTFNGSVSAVYSGVEADMKGDAQEASGDQENKHGLAPSSSDMRNDLGSDACPDVSEFMLRNRLKGKVLSSDTFWLAGLRPPLRNSATAQKEETLVGTQQPPASSAVHDTGSGIPHGYIPADARGAVSPAGRKCTERGIPSTDSNLFSAGQLPVQVDHTAGAESREKSADRSLEELLNSGVSTCGATNAAGLQNPEHVQRQSPQLQQQLQRVPTSVSSYVIQLDNPDKLMKTISKNNQKVEDKMKKILGSKRHKIAYKLSKCAELSKLVAVPIKDLLGYLHMESYRGKVVNEMLLQWALGCQFALQLSVLTLSADKAAADKDNRDSSAENSVGSKPGLEAQQNPNIQGSSDNVSSNGTNSSDSESNSESNSDSDSESSCSSSSGSGSSIDQGSRRNRKPRYVQTKTKTKISRNKPGKKISRKTKVSSSIT